MSLPHAILGFLNYAPMTGYDLKKAFDTSVRHFWPADQAQIYRTLKELMRQGWVTVEVVPQEDRPNRKVYHITEAGREELRRWLRTPTAPEDPRVPLLVKVFFAGGLADEEAAALLEAMPPACGTGWRRTPGSPGRPPITPRRSGRRARSFSGR